jgi:hypothetical protein
MTTPASYSKAPPSMRTAALAQRTYWTKTSFVAVHFNRSGKGRIVFLPYGAELRVIGPSSCLREGFEVAFEHQHYHVFEIDLTARSAPMGEPIRSRVAAA